ncbi:MAG: tetratricopeptide repeat protein [Bacteroidetes bacterium]|nr:tetratricopeptide repeat protein [Bacteroidota bacterium]
MNRILPFLLIAFLISCTNQQSEDKTTEPVQEETGVLSIEPNEPANPVDEETQTANPDVNTIKPAEKSSDLKGERDTEAAYLFNKGTTAYNNEDFESGVGIFEQIVEMHPDDRKAYYNLGLGYFKLNKFSNALLAFNKAIEILPEDVLSIQYRGRVYYMLENFPKCLDDYTKVVELKPEDPLAYYNRGTAKGRVNDYLGAIRDFDKAIELKPEYAEAYYNRGLANYFQGRRHEACYDWRKAHGLGHYESEKAIRSYCEGDQ